MTSSMKEPAGGGVQKKNLEGTDHPSENCKVNPLKMMQYVRQL